MKVTWRSMLALLGALMLLPAASMADGLPSYRPGIRTTDTPIVQGGFKWTGLYVGGGLGYQWSDRSADPPKYEWESFIGDGHFVLGELKAGLDYQVADHVILGVFGTWSPNLLLGTSDVDNIYSVGGRIGLTGPNLLVYVGGAWVRVESLNTTLDGWAALGGFEAPLTNAKGLNLTWGVEYKYQDVDGASAAFTGIEDRSHTVMGRINIRLGNF